MSKHLTAILGGCWLLLAHLAIASEAERNWGFDLSASESHQSYREGSADFTSLDFAPYWNLGNWSLSADLPWQRIEGNYFSNGRFPRLASLCERLSSYSPARIQLLIARGRITAQQVQTCHQLAALNAQANESRSGLGDVSFFANYQRDLNAARTWWLGVGLGYSLDTGDYDKSLGNGTRDLSLQASIGTTQGRWNLHWMAGYTQPQATASTDDLQNYAQAAFDLSYDLSDSFSLGANYQFAQSAIVDEANLQLWQLYADWRLGSAWMIHAHWSRYAQEADFPDSEFGASLTFSY